MSLNYYIVKVRMYEDVIYEDYVEAESVQDAKDIVRSKLENLEIEAYKGESKEE